MYLRPQEVRQIYKLSHTTLLDLEKEGKLCVHKTPKGHRRYKISDLDCLMSKYEIKDDLPVLEIYYDTLQELPERVILLGKKPILSKEIAPHDKEWSEPSWNLFIEDTPKLNSCNYNAIYTRRKYADISELPIEIERMFKDPFERVILCGTGTTLDYSHKHCRVTQPFFMRSKQHNEIVIQMADILSYLDLKDTVSQEVPIAFISRNICKDSDGDLKIERVVYECDLSCTNSQD